MSKTELDGTDAEAIVAAQQEMLRTGKGAGWGYVSSLSAEDKAAEEQRTDEQVNSPDDQYEATGVAPIALGRDPDADHSDMELDEGEEIGVPGSRVGFATVSHPRARQASALHDHLKGYAPSELSFDELHDAATAVGMNVEGSGKDGAILKADFVQAMDGLLAQYPGGGSAAAEQGEGVKPARHSQQ